MAFVRTKRKGNRIYYYLVENRREGERVRQKVIKYLGAEPPTKEQIENIIARERSQGLIAGRSEGGSR